jgi:hypothetical protein
LRCGCWLTSAGDKLLIDAYRGGEQDIHTLTASQVFGVLPLMVNAGATPPRQGGELRHRVRADSPFGLSQATRH